MNALIQRAQDLIKQITFPGYEFDVRHGHGGVFLQAKYVESDAYSGVPEMQFTRKWILSPHMTDSEIVQTVFKCCYTSFEHRCREFFLYKGKRIFGPHFDIEDLVALCQHRENAGGRDFEPRRIDP